jgi:hypothetical protein
VTECHGTTLWAEAQQVRLHESTALHCHVSVTGGAILEDCSDIVFYEMDDDDQQLLAQIKDFNWLKQGVASPNFRIEKKDPASSCQSPFTYPYDLPLPTAGPPATDDEDRPPPLESLEDEQDGDEL